MWSHGRWYQWYTVHLWEILIPHWATSEGKRKVPIPLADLAKAGVYRMFSTWKVLLLFELTVDNDDILCCVAVTIIEISQARKNHGSRDWCSKLRLEIFLICWFGCPLSVEPPPSHRICKQHHDMCYGQSSWFPHLCPWSRWWWQTQQRRCEEVDPSWKKVAKQHTSVEKEWKSEWTCFDDSFHVTKNRIWLKACSWCEANETMR